MKFILKYSSICAPKKNELIFNLYKHKIKHSNCLMAMTLIKQL